MAEVKLSRSSSADPRQYLAADYVSDTYQHTLDISATGPLVNKNSFFVASFNLHSVRPFGSSFLFRSSTVRSASATKHLYTFSIVDAQVIACRSTYSSGPKTGNHVIESDMYLHRNA
jgi:hypothetical protein